MKTESPKSQLAHPYFDGVPRMPDEILALIAAEKSLTEEQEAIARRSLEAAMAVFRKRKARMPENQGVKHGSIAEVIHRVGCRRAGRSPKD